MKITFNKHEKNTGYIIACIIIILQLVAMVTFTLPNPVVFTYFTAFYACEFAVILAFIVHLMVKRYEDNNINQK